MYNTSFKLSSNFKLSTDESIREVEDRVVTKIIESHIENDCDYLDLKSERSIYDLKSSISYAVKYDNKAFQSLAIKLINRADINDCIKNCENDINLLVQNILTKYFTDLLISNVKVLNANLKKYWNE